MALQHGEVCVVLKEGKVEANSDCCDETIDKFAYGFAVSTTSSV